MCNSSGSPGRSSVFEKALQDISWPSLMSSAVLSCKLFDESPDAFDTLHRGILVDCIRSLQKGRRYCCRNRIIGISSCGCQNNRSPLSKNFVKLTKAVRLCHWWSCCIGKIEAYGCIESHWTFSGGSWCQSNQTLKSLLYRQMQIRQYLIPASSKLRDQSAESVQESPLHGPLQVLESGGSDRWI